MVDGLMNIKQEYLAILVEPFCCEIDKSPTIEEEKQFNFVEGAAIFDLLVKLGISRDRVHFILDIFALQKFLYEECATDKIFKVQRASTSRAENKTTDTSATLISPIIF